MATIQQITEVLEKTKSTRYTNTVHQFAHQHAVNELHKSKSLLEGMIKRGLFEGGQVKGPKEAVNQIDGLLKQYDY